MSRKIIVSLSLLIFIISTFLLATGSELLVISLLKDPPLPLGNVLTWLGFIAFPLSIWFGIGSLYNPETKSDRFFRNIAMVMVLFGLLWAPVSALLAGNLENNFSGSVVGFQGSEHAARIFWVFSYTLAAAPMALLISYGIYRLLKKR